MAWDCRVLGQCVPGVKARWKAGWGSAPGNSWIQGGCVDGRASRPHGVYFELAENAGHNLDMTNFDYHTMETWLDAVYAGNSGTH